MRLIDFEILCKMHNLIYRQCTGNAREFADKVGLGRAQLGKYLNYCLLTEYIFGGKRSISAFLNEPIFGRELSSIEKKII